MALTSLSLKVAAWCNTVSAGQYTHTVVTVMFQVWVICIWHVHQSYTSFICRITYIFGTTLLYVIACHSHSVYSVWVIRTYSFLTRWSPSPMYCTLLLHCFLLHSCPVQLWWPQWGWLLGLSWSKCWLQMWLLPTQLHPEQLNLWEQCHPDPKLPAVWGYLCHWSEWI